MPLAPEVDLDRVAATTPGMVGADLANLANEAALLAARRSHARIGMADFNDALERIVLGAARKIVLSDADRRRTAVHEAGHAIVGMLTPEADRVRKVSIIPRGAALGVTFASPADDRFSYDVGYLLARIKVALAGRAEEELVYGAATTGAEADIRQLTEIARQMVGRWGMSPEIGPVAVLPESGSGRLVPDSEARSEHMQLLVDAEVRRIVGEAEEEVAELLREHRDQLEALADALVAHETLDETEAYAAAGIGQEPDRPVIDGESHEPPKLGLLRSGTSDDAGIGRAVDGAPSQAATVGRTRSLIHEEVTMIRRRTLLVVAAAALCLAGAGVQQASAAYGNTTVRVTAKDFSFALSTKTVEHGVVTFVIKNAGASPTTSRSPDTARRPSARARRRD